jgi:hypothetical protein
VAAAKSGTGLRIKFPRRVLQPGDHAFGAGGQLVAWVHWGIFPGRVKLLDGGALVLRSK